MFIDIHVHLRTAPGPLKNDKQAYAVPEQLIARYDKLEIERGCILPRVSPECALTMQSNEEMLEIHHSHPDRFIPFCNIDPRQLTNSADAPLGNLLAYYREKGCRGIGEVVCNMAFDNPFVENLFRCCEKAELPLIFHIAPSIGGFYGLYDDPGLPRLEQALEKFPNLVFLGHSQPFWAEIGSLPELDDPGKRNIYPEGPVEEEGRVVELMRKYPNLHGDLSANSGYNAVSRDEEFGTKFLEEFQDRLCFGTDICAPDTPVPLPSYLLRLKEEERLSETAFNKIARENAARLLGL